MPLTFAELKAELRLSLFPAGEATNLVEPHDRMFVEAMVDLQQFVECLQVNNTQIVPACDTLFKCGYTVFDCPRGHINRIYVIDRINQTTGLEDATAPVDWCSAVDYRQCDYSDLDRYVSQSLAGTCGAGSLFGWFNGLFGGVPLGSLIAFPNYWFAKYVFPPPTDAGLEKAPPLPLGFHYAQTSTNAPTGRAQFGLWAKRGGQIYLAPWIQSTETIVIDWDGLKRDWQDLDLVDDDPILKQAVEAYVLKEHARKYEHDYDESESATQAYNEAKARLMYECRQENEIRDADRSGSSAARGASSIATIYVNDAQQATAQCPAGTTGDATTYTQDAGTVQSTVSKEDANSKARSQALQQAGLMLNCITVAPTYYNSVDHFYKFPCQGGGSSLVKAGTVSSAISVADADFKAEQLAITQAEAASNCAYWNVEKFYTAKCPSDESIENTVTIAAHTYQSSDVTAALGIPHPTQKDVDDYAQTQAQNQASAGLVCPGDDVFYASTVQVSSRFNNPAFIYCHSRTSNTGPDVKIYGNATIPAGAFTRYGVAGDTSVQSELNQLAREAAYAAALADAKQQCFNQGGVQS